MLYFATVRSAVLGPLLLPPALHHPRQGGTHPEPGTSKEVSFWMHQGCVGTASPAVAVGCFQTARLKPQSRVRCDPLPRTLCTQCCRHHFQKAILVIFNLLVNYRWCSPLATALVLSNLHKRDKVPAVKTLLWPWEVDHVTRGPADARGRIATEQASGD